METAPAPGTLQGETTYERLCDEIRSGKLPPGSRLRETEIAERLDVSRTPVREAIRRLEAEGLVDHLPRSGAVVRTLDYPELMELYEMRTVLEGTAARLAARAASPVELEELVAINDEMRAATLPEAAIQLNRQFHRLLLDAARNRFLLRAVATVENTLLILGTSSMAMPDRAREAVDEHREVLEALQSRDGAAAEAAMRRHMERAQFARLRILRRARAEDGE
ncbi:GntR family transcriptional regulator [Paracoccus xiamenensis]|uniref:GntR family transcriptional regulator n=1 Tax=Paracoccus xiamenensis TaxID=2714901 RepID=UPI0014099B03|nr:GntR family transcriptional regulator [Paracoccus xiamenensis]NHF73874.1 GntR family transcriptional regulator [Paracoccus xiamenensis]